MNIDYTIPKLTGEIDRLKTEKAKIEQSLPYLSGKQYFEAEGKIADYQVRIEKAEDELMSHMSGKKADKTEEKETKMDNYFVTLNNINVSGKTEDKNGLTYLSWVWAWGEVKKLFPDANYTVYENKDGWNYFTDGKTCWVKTGVTLNGIEHIEYLPVMDFKNKSIKADMVTSFDVNKAIQRSLTKAIARHGLGLYIYAGEDLPECEAEEKKNEPKKDTITDIMEKTIVTKINGDDKLLNYILKTAKIEKLSDMSIKVFKNLMDKWDNVVAGANNEK